LLGAVHTVTRRIPCKQNAAKYVPNPDGPISQVDFGSPRSSLKMEIANSDSGAVFHSSQEAPKAQAPTQDVQVQHQKK
jgi:hypothetical protein